jgi:hypothetical protein
MHTNIPDNDFATVRCIDHRNWLCRTEHDRLFCPSGYHAIAATQKKENARMINAQRAPFHEPDTANKNALKKERSTHKSYVPRTRMTLKTKTVHSIGWSTTSQVARMLMQILISALLARLLVPSDFGLIAMIGVFASFVAISQNLGLQHTTIQKKRFLMRRYLRFF